MMGDGSCLSRTEFLSHPHLKDLNAIRAAYSDYHCRESFEHFDRYEEPLRTNEAG